MTSEKKLKVVILSRTFAKSTKEPIEYMQKQGLICEVRLNSTPEDENTIVELIGDADAVIVGSDRIGSLVIEKCKNLKVISKHGVGTDNINLEEAAKRNIAVTITRDSNSETVADLTWLLILGTSRNILNRSIQYDNVLQRWKNSLLGYDVFEKKLGIIGFGAIGKRVASRAQGFNNEVLVYDPFIEELDAQPNIRKVDLDELLAKADIISLHLPLTPETKNLINAHSIKKMKEGVIIINTSRGQLIDEKALLEALENGKVRAAGLDVFSEEPPVGNPLLHQKNVMATPHIGTHTFESNYRMGMMAAENIVKVLIKKDGD